MFAPGSRDFDEEIKFYTDIGIHDGFAICGFLGPGSQGGAEAPVEEFMGGSTPMAQPIRTKIENL